MSESRISEEALVRAMNPRNERTPSLAELGELFGVTKQAVHERLGVLGLVKPHSPRPRRRENPVPRCHLCDRALSSDSPVCLRRRLCKSCDPLRQYVSVRCGNCGNQFSVKLHVLLTRYRRNPSRTVPPMENKKCFGEWCGRYYGSRFLPKEK